MTRQTSNWLEAYDEYTQESESPDSYHLFCGLCAISSAIRRNVWINQGLYLLYPNLFVVLVGPPGRCGKSTAIRLARQLLYKVPGVIIGPDSVTREELIRLLAKSNSGGQSALTIHSTELSSLLEPSGIKMIQFLTDIYDCEYSNPKGWTYATKGSGSDSIVAPYVTMLAATTPSYIADGMPPTMVGHGFTSRVIFVFEEKERKLNPFPNEPDQKLVTALEKDLIHISKLKGSFRWSKDAREYYKVYYKDLRSHEPTDHRIEGFHWRKRIHILKLASLVSLADNDDLVITVKNLQDAEAILRLVEPKMARTFSAVGKYEHAADLERIQTIIIDAGAAGIPQEDLLRSQYFAGPLSVLTEMLASLIMMGVVEKKEEHGRWIVRAKSDKPIWEK